MVDSEFYNDCETFSKLVQGNENDIATNEILGSLEILVIKKLPLQFFGSTYMFALNSIFLVIHKKRGATKMIAKCFIDSNHPTKAMAMNIIA